MPLQNFVDKVGPAISAAWLNLVDGLLTTVFGGAQTKADARAALTSDAPMSIAQGGTGATTAAGARSNIGAAGVADNNIFGGNNTFNASTTFNGGNTFTSSNTFTGPTVVNHTLGKGANYTVTASDAGAEIQFSGLTAPATVTLPDGVTVGFSVIIADWGDTANAVTISRQTTSTLWVDGSNRGVTTYTLSRGERVRCFYDGFSWTLIPNQPRVIGLPSGGDKGPGTINVQSGVYDNGNRKALGTWGTFVANTVYQASADTLVVCTAQQSGNGYIQLDGYTDSSNPPTTIRQSAITNVSGGWCAITFPVRRNDYFKVVASGTATVVAFNGNLITF
jgi:hypothetical protein